MFSSGKSLEIPDELLNISADIGLQPIPFWYASPVWSQLIPAKVNSLFPYLAVIVEPLWYKATPPFSSIRYIKKKFSEILTYQINN